MCDSTPHARGFQDALLSAQLDLGDALSRAIGTRRLDRAAYLRWLAAEHEFCRVGAVTLDGIALRMGDGGGRSWAVAQAAALREAGRLSAADVRRTDSTVAADPVELDHWRDFLDQHAGSPRPYPAIGAIALHATVTGGAARAAIAALLELQWLPEHGDSYLKHRRGREGEEAPSWFDLWQALPDADARRDVIEGARRAVEMYGLACRATLRATSAATTRPRWTWHARQDAA